MSKGRPSRIRQFILALILGAAVVLVANAAIDLILGNYVSKFEYLTIVDVAVTFGRQILFAGLPFFVLAARNDRRPLMWVIALILTCASWTYYVWQVWRDSLTGFAGGANIGMGLIMIASPFVILLVLKGVSLVAASRRS